MKPGEAASFEAFARSAQEMMRLAFAKRLGFRARLSETGDGSAELLDDVGAPSATATVRGRQLELPFGTAPAAPALIAARDAEPAEPREAFAYGMQVNVNLHLELAKLDLGMVFTLTMVAEVLWTSPLWGEAADRLFTWGGKHKVSLTPRKIRGGPGAWSCSKCARVVPAIGQLGAVGYCGACIDELDNQIADAIVGRNGREAAASSKGYRAELRTKKRSRTTNGGSP